MSSPLPANRVYTSPPRETSEEARREAPPEESKEETKVKEANEEEVTADEAKEDEVGDEAPVTESLRDIEISDWREKFLLTAFGLDKDGKPLPNRPRSQSRVLKSKEEYDVLVSFLEAWGSPDLQKTELTQSQKDFRRQNKRGYNFVKTYKVVEVELIGGERKKELRSVEDDKLFVHQLNVFDALLESHIGVGHFKTEKTVVPVHSCHLKTLSHVTGTSQSVYWASQPIVCNRSSAPRSPASEASGRPAAA